MNEQHLSMLRVALSEHADDIRGKTPAQILDYLHSPTPKVIGTQPVRTRAGEVLAILGADVARLIDSTTRAALISALQTGVPEDLEDWGDVLQAGGLITAEQRSDIRALLHRTTDVMGDSPPPICSWFSAKALRIRHGIARDGSEDDKLGDYGGFPNTVTLEELTEAL